MSSVSKKYNSIPMILLLTSVLIIPVENMKSSNKCTKPTVDNPFMNYNIMDPPKKLPACKYEYKQVSKFIGKDIFGRFNTMPVTTVVNDQKGFALSLYPPSMGNCKSNGKDCGKYINNTFHTSRLN